MALITYRTSVTCLPEAKRSREPNDCTVTALAVSANLSYRASCRFWTWLGRQYGRPIYVPVGSHVRARRFGLRSFLTPVPFRARSLTLKTFLSRFPEGRYFVLLANHAIAVVDGQAYGWIQSTRRIVIGAWRVRTVRK
jgi:hypothetical protein